MIEQWFTKITPTEFSFTVMFFFIVMTGLYLFAFRYVPWHFKVKWPAEHALKEKRVDAELRAKEEEVKESRLLREAIQEMGVGVKQIALLIDQHDRRSIMDRGDMMTMLRVLLEKSGIDQATLQSLTTKDEARSFEKTLREILDASKQKPPVVPDLAKVQP